MDFYSVDPWDERRADLRDATNTAILANELRGVDNTIRVAASAWGGKMPLRRDVIHPRDLMPIFDPDEREREGRNANRNGSTIEQDKRRAREYAERFHSETREAKALLGLEDGIRPGAMEPVIAKVDESENGI
jgi:hypothetical protein